MPEMRNEIYTDNSRGIKIKWQNTEYPIKAVNQA